MGLMGGTGDTAEEIANSGSIVMNATDNPGMTRALILNPGDDQYGYAVISLKVSDGIEHSTHQFKLTVASVNDDPSFTKGGNQSVAEDSGRQTVAWATDISTMPPGVAAAAGLAGTDGDESEQIPSLEFSLAPEGDGSFVLFSEDPENKNKRKEK